MIKDMKEVKLKVMEALQEEAYKGIVRVDSETMHVIGVRPGDIIEIEGQRKTVGIVDRAYPTDVGQQVIRMDGIIRRNAKTSIGEIITVRKANVLEAKSITIAPSQQGIVIQASPELFRRGLLGRAVIKGDIISLGGARRRRRTMEDSPFEEIFNVFEEGFMGSFGLPSLKFVVVDSNPKQAVIVSETTIINVTQKAVEVSDEKIPEVTYEDLGGLEDEIKKVREMVELPLKHPEIFTRLGIEPPSGVLLHGPPGSGKTLLAKAVANESEANFMLINGPEVMNKFYGESERKIREIFEEAEKNAPSIIFIDEIDAIAPKREETRGEVERRVVAQLLTVLDGLKSRKNVIVIGASVTGDTPIMIRDENGIRILPIGEFVDKYYKEGEENIEKNVNNIYTLGFDKREINTYNRTYFDNTAFKKVSSVFRHKVNEIYEIEYVGGKIRTTGNHSVFVRTKQGLEYKSVALLKQGEILVDLPYKVNSHVQKVHKFPMNLNLELPIHSVPLIERCYEQALGGESINQISVESGKHRSTVYRWKSGESIPEELSNGYCHLLPSTVKVTPELMRLLGYYAAEGYARKEVDFCFGTHEGELIEDSVNLMKQIFNVEPSDIRIAGSRTNIVYNIKPLANFFKKYCGKGAYNKHLPSFIFEAPREYFLEFIKGYLAGDGYKFDDGKLQITSVSKQIIIELNWLLKMHGIKSYLSKTTAKAGRKIGDHTINKDSIGYRVNIPKTANPFIENNVLNAKRARIKAIKKLPYDDYVYDLCGCDNEAFFGGESPILLHNTNRPNALDPALRRPGRFDREISINVPDKKGRLEILKIHTRNMPIIPREYYPDIIEVRLREKIGSLYNKNLKDIEKLEEQLKELNQQKKKADNSIIQKILNKIKDIEGNIAEVNLNINQIEVLQKTIIRDKKFADSVIKKLKKVFESKIKYGLEDPRQKIIENSLGEIDKKLTSSLINLGIVDEELKNKIEKDSVLRDLELLANTTHGFVGADLSALAKEAAMNVLRRILPDLKLNEKEPISEEVLQKLRVTSEDFKEAMKIVRPSAIREVLIEKPNVNWKDIGGLDELKQELIEAVEWPLKYKDSFTRLGIRPPRGILMYGPPGTGKTLLAKAVATESEANFINVKGPSLLNMFVGESERGIRQIFEKARQVAPTIIFFDEIDSIAPRRGLTVGTRVTERMLNTLLAEMDGLQELNDVVVIAATNRPDIIDPALLRPGRFDRIISTQIPDKKSRLEILNIHTQKMPLSADVDLNKLVDLTENFSGADIEEVCREAAMLSLRESIKSKEIRMDHFLESLQKTGPSLTIEDAKRYKEIEEELKMARSAQAKQETPSYLG